MEHSAFLRRATNIDSEEQPRTILTAISHFWNENEKGMVSSVSLQQFFNDLTHRCSFSKGLCRHFKK